MSAALIVALLGLVFAGTHIALSIGPIRRRLVSVLGERGFILVFFCVAWVTFTAFIVYSASHLSEGPRGLALGESPIAGPILGGIVVVGVSIMAAGLFVYLRSPYGPFSTTARQPEGLERITRHPFFVGTALFMLGHALLARHLTGAILFFVLGLLSLLGAWHQDMKLAALRGRAYSNYMSATSAVPFAAIVTRKQILVLAEIPWLALLVGLLLAAALWFVHDTLFVFNGALFIGGVMLGSLYFLVMRWRKALQDPHG